MSISRTGCPTPHERELIATLVGAVTEADGVDPLNENAHFAVRGHRPAVHWLARHSGDQLAGYAQYDSETNSIIVAVHPSFRRLGLGGQLLDTARTLAPSATVWAFGNLPEAQALAAARGLNQVRALLIMRRDLTTSPLTDADQAPAANGIEIIPFRDSLLDALVETNAEAFAHHPEQGALTRADFEQRMAEPWFDPAGLFLALDDETGRLLGYHWTKIENHSGQPATEGEVYAIGVRPDAEGRGLGRALLAAGMAYLQAQGVAAIVLYVEASSQRAVQIYESASFVEVNRDASYR